MFDPISKGIIVGALTSAAISLHYIMKALDRIAKALDEAALHAKVTDTRETAKLD